MLEEAEMSQIERNFLIENETSQSKKATFIGGRETENVCFP
jgi:hypothetical protein